MPNPEKSADECSTLSDEEIDEAQTNLERCLDALDKNGEAGLQAELERIHPEPSGHRRIPLPNFPGSFARLIPEPETVDSSTAPKTGR